MQGTDIALHCGFVPPTMDLRFLSTGSGATRYTSIRPPKTGGYYSYRVSIILMLTDCNHCCCRLLLCKFTWERALWQALKGRVRLSRTPRRTKNELPLTVNLRWRRKLKRRIFLLKNHGARQSHTHLTIPRKWKSQVLLTSWQPWWIVLNLKPTSSSNLTT